VSRLPPSRNCDATVLPGTAQRCAASSAEVKTLLRLDATVPP
jgi:hypothetical protein